MLRNRIAAFVNLPLHALDALTTQRRLDQIGQPAVQEKVAAA